MPNVVYIYQEQEEEVSSFDLDLASESASDADSESGLLQKTKTVKLTYCIKNKKGDGFDSGELDNLTDLTVAQAEGIKSRLPKVYGYNRLYDAEQLKAVFKKTKKNNHTENEHGILTLFQTNPQAVGDGLKVLYPMITSEDLDDKSVTKNKEKRLKFLQMLEEVQLVYDTLIDAGINPSCYFFSNYARELAIFKEDLAKEERENRKNQDKKTPKNFSDILLSKTINNINWCENKGNKFSLALYGLFCTAGFATAVAAFVAPSSSAAVYLGDALASHVTSSIWNQSDSGTGSVGALNQYLQGEEGMAIENVVGNVQMTASTVLANLAVDLSFSPIVALPVVVISGLLGVSFALAMLVPIGIAMYAEKKCEEELVVIRAKIKTLNTEKTGNVEQQKLQIKIDTLKRAEVLKEIEKKNHQLDKRVWTGAAITMAAVAAVCFLTLSAVTMGGVPAAMVVATGLAFIGMGIRAVYVDYQKRKNFDNAMEENNAYSLFGLKNKEQKKEVEHQEEESGPLLNTYR